MAKDYDDEIDLEQTGGFGRAAVAEAAQRPTYRSTVGQVDERDRRQEAQASMAKSAAPKRQSFNQAFAAARKAGDKTFMFGGKKYTTDLAKPAAKKDPDADKGPSNATIERLERRAAEKDPDADKGPSKEAIERLERRAAAPRVSQAKGSMKEKMRAMGVTRFKSGCSVKSSASKRADGCAVRGKTRGRMV